MNRILAGDRVTSKTLYGVYTVVENNYDGSCIITDTDGHQYTVHTSDLRKS